MAINQKGRPGSDWRWWPPSAWSLGAFAITATTVIALAGLSGWWFFWRRLGAGLVGTDRTSAMFDLARSTVTLLGVLTIGGAAAVAYRRQQTLERQQRLGEERARLEQDHAQLEQDHAQLERDQAARGRRSDLHTRYQQAAAQLGHKEPIIRVAGVYALEALAVEWATIDDKVQRNVCIDLLCGYLRSTRGITIQPDRLPVMDEAENDVRSTIATVIARHLNSPRAGDWSDHFYDLNGAHLRAAEFGRANFRAGAGFIDAHFHGVARFDQAHFLGSAGFDRAHFREDVWFIDAHFDDTAGFDHAHFDRFAWFKGARFHANVGFNDAHFHGSAGFDRARFHGSAWFDHAHFHRSAGFDHTHFRGVGFIGTHFHANVGFNDAHFCDAAWFDHARFHGSSWFEDAHFHGDVSLRESRPRLRGALVVSGYLTTTAQKLGAAELLVPIDCALCKEMTVVSDSTPVSWSQLPVRNRNH